MEIQNIKSIIKKILHDSDADLDRMYLFGSRATKRFNRFSDYDILVIVNQDLTIAQKKILSKNIRSTFARLHIDLDILIKSSHELQRSLNRTGSVVKQAMKEGILL